MNITVNGVSDKPVTLSVSRNIDNVVTQVNQFTQTFNDMIDKIKDLTKWDSTTNTGGLLLGDSTVREVETKVYNMLDTVNPTAGRYRILADVGITLGDGAKITFDEEKFRAAYANDPDSVQALFTATSSVVQNGKTTTVTTGLGYTIESVISTLTDPSNGIITQENQTLDERAQQFQDRITQLNATIDQKRTRLQTQFANLESVLANLQNQQKAISGITTMSYGTTTASK